MFWLYINIVFVESNFWCIFKYNVYRESPIWVQIPSLRHFSFVGLFAWLSIN